MNIIFDRILDRLRERDSDGGGSSGGGYPSVSSYANLPSPASSYTGQIYAVLTDSGPWYNKKPKGFYISNGTTWEFFANLFTIFQDTDFKIYDDNDPTKFIAFDVALISGGTVRTYQAPDKDGIIALTSDLFLSGLTDTNILNPGNGQILAYSGGTWVNTFMDASGVTGPNNYLLSVTGSGNSAVTFARVGLTSIVWDASHNHNELYYNKLEVYNTGQTYSDTQVNNLLLGYSLTGHTHPQYLTGFTESDPVWNAEKVNYSLTSHTHTQYLTGFTESDPVWLSQKGYYYTSAQTNALYSLTSHTHAQYLTGFTESDPVWNAQKVNYSLTSHTHDNLYYRKNEVYNSGQTDILLSHYSLTSHTHTTASITDLSGYTGFTNYYTSNQVNILTASTYNLSVNSAISYVNSKNYLTGFTESDPVWNVEKVNYSLTSHTHSQYITGFTETDPVWNAQKINYSLTSHTHNINTLSGITVSAATNGQVLTYLNGVWINSASTGSNVPGATTLSGLTDVSLSSLYEGQVLTYTGGLWKNEYVSGGTGSSEQFSVMSAPTGFENRTDSIISFDKTGKTFTIKPTLTSYNVWSKGVKYVKNTVINQLINTGFTGIHFFYFNSGGTFTYTTTPWSLLSSDATIAIVYWNSTLQDGWIGEERHGTVMDEATHYRLHVVDGTKVTSQFLLYGYLIPITPVVPTNTGNTIGITPGTITDEDLNLKLSPLGSEGPYTVWYRSGANDWYWKSGSTYPFDYTVGGYINYNHFNGSSWSLTQVVDNRWLNIYLVATNAVDVNYQYQWIVGQSVYTTLNGAQNESFSTLQFGTMPYTEFAAIYKIIYRSSSSFSTDGKVRIESVQTVTNNNTMITLLGDHNNLIGLQGGLGGEYYHLSQYDYNNVLGLSGRTYSLSGLTDVNLGSPVNGEGLVYQNGEWVNQIIPDTNNYLTNVSGNGNSAVTFERSELTDLIWDASHNHPKSQITDFVEDDYVHKTGNESITGNKTFSGDTKLNTLTLQSGVTVFDISNDSGLTNSSSTSLVTEQAVKLFFNDQYDFCYDASIINNVKIPTDLRRGEVFTNLSPYLIPYSSEIIGMTLTSDGNATWTGSTLINNVEILSVYNNNTDYSSVINTSIIINKNDKLRLRVTGIVGEVDKPSITVYFKKK